MENKGKLQIQQSISKINSKFKLSDHSKIRRRRSDHCLNCQTKFEPSVNFCPNCGQENNHNVAHFGSVLIDFINNYFSFDSKFSNSLFPFFFKPGYLTKRFVEGQRFSFVNPIRMYLVLSLLFFFIFSILSQDFYNSSIKEIENNSITLPDTVNQRTDKPKYLTFPLIQKESDQRLLPIKKNLPDSVSFETKSNELDNSFFSDDNISTYIRLRQDYSIATSQLIDSLNTRSLTAKEIYFFRQMIRIDRSEKQIVISHVLKNLPIMMLLLIPLLAIVLKIFYFRNNEFYITHLVHALHLHSFAYLIYGLVFLTNLYWLNGHSENMQSWLIFICFNIVCIYSYISFRNVYNQNWKKTLLKFNIIGFVYFWLLSISICAEVYFSVITF